MKLEQFTNKQGFSLVEVILSIALFMVIVLGTSSGLSYSISSRSYGQYKSKAIYLMDEGLEAARSIRNEDFANLADGTYGLDSTGSAWSLTGTSDTVDDLTRVIEVSTIDSNTKQVTATVTWPITYSNVNEVSASEYLTNWQRETITNFWVTPVLSSTINASGNNNGRKVQVLGNHAYVIRQGGNVDGYSIDVQNSAAPNTVDTENLSNNTFDIAIGNSRAFITSSSNNAEIQVYNLDSGTGNMSFNNSINLSGNANANGIKIEGNYAYVVRQGSGSDELVIVDITAGSPGVVGSTDIGFTVNDVAVSGNFAYLGTDNNSQDIVIAYVGFPTFPFFTGTLNVPGNNNIDSVMIMNGMLALGKDNGDFALYDITNPYSPVALGTYDANDNINDMDYDPANNYVFLATDYNPAEFQVIDISNPNAISFVGSLNLSGDINGVAFDAARNLVYAVGDDNSEEFRIISPF